MTDDMLYFGCWSGSGHFLYDKYGNYVRSGCPFHHVMMGSGRISSGPGLDGGYCPQTKAYQPKGVAKLTHISDWTIIAFYDRSMDKRYNSNAAFLTKGTHTFEEMVEAAKAQFPGIWARYKFEVREHHADG